MGLCDRNKSTESFNFALLQFPAMPVMPLYAGGRAHFDPTHLWTT